MNEKLQEFRIPVPWIRIYGTIVSLIALIILYVTPEDTDLVIKIAVFLLGALAGGWFFYVETVEAIFEKRKITIDVLMTLAIIGSASLGALEEALTIVFLYSITETLEGYTVKRTRTTIKSLMTLVPKTATKIIDGKEISVPVEELKPGDIILLRPGDYIPVDGVVAEGKGLVDEAAITGESVPVLKSLNDLVFGGTICQDSVLNIRVEKPVSESTVARIITLVEDAQKRKVPSQLLIEKFTR
ncbi:MAG: cation-translocating P-type ATPase [Methanobacteriota archaeon]|nr:MAG: cation-translocating P-type ATPase [Euryarchaeota archaeon]